MIENLTSQVVEFGAGSRFESLMTDLKSCPSDA